MAINIERNQSLFRGFVHETARSKSDALKSYTQRQGLFFPEKRKGGKIGFNKKDLRT